MNRDELAVEVRYVAGEGMTMTAAESVVDRLLPLIEADVRERIATEIEAMESFAHGKNKVSLASLIGYGTAARRAARIARLADHD